LTVRTGTIPTLRELGSYPRFLLRGPGRGLRVITVFRADVLLLPHN
jgi:hypothetical protein